MKTLKALSRPFFRLRNAFSYYVPSQSIFALPNPLRNYFFYFTRRRGRTLVKCSKIKKLTTYLRSLSNVYNKTGKKITKITFNKF